MADRLRGVTRRELLKLSPLLGARGVRSCRHGAIALLEAGVAWSDEASQLLFRRDMPCSRVRTAESCRFDRFPYNYYDVLEPDIDFDDVGTEGRRRGRSSRAVYARPDSRAAEGDAEHAARLRRRLGRRGPLRRRAARRFSRDGRRGPERALSDGDVRGRLLRIARHRDGAHPQSLLCYEMYDRPLDARARRAAAAHACRPRSATSTRSTS